MTKTRQFTARPSDDEAITNPSDNPTFDSILQKRLSRRTLMRGGIGAGAAFMFGVPLIGCDGSSSGSSPLPTQPMQTTLGFSAIPKSMDDMVHVPAGYRAQVFIPWGAPINGLGPVFDDVNASNSGAEQELQVGAHHDGMYYFPIDGSSTRGVLCVNHEYIDIQYIHPNGPTVDPATGARTVADEVRKEIACHGVSVLEIEQASSGDWQVLGSALNRRITGGTVMSIGGPVRGSSFVNTLFSPDGTLARGTLNNCANGFTPWGTYLTCEENWAGYLVNKDLDASGASAQPREHSRYGVATGIDDDQTRYGWETVTGVDAYARFDASTTGADATQDYRNEPNTFGWVVEIDPFDPGSIPIKRTAMGRMGHEGCWVGKVEEGRPLAFYMGDDARFEYIYKFVTRDAYFAATASGHLLDNGTLYVAKFNEDGSGEWVALAFGENGLTAGAAVPFTSQADVLVNTRLAADVVGATKMDRPEWGAVHPETGEIYMTLTNNTNRDGLDGNPGADAANPRAPNVYGHIIRWREDGDAPAATSFTWDIFVFGSSVTEPAEINRSGLTEDNEFASPDGLWFDPRGILWIQTDNGGNIVADATNEQMLAVVPGSIGDGGITSANTADLRRFFVGPLECEITGIDITPDGKTMFLNIQHPGEDGSPFPDASGMSQVSSTFPGGTGTRPRSCTIVVTREDGGVVGL